MSCNEAKEKRAYFNLPALGLDPRGSDDDNLAVIVALPGICKGGIATKMLETVNRCLFLKQSDNNKKIKKNTSSIICHPQS